MESKKVIEKHFRFSIDDDEKLKDLAYKSRLSESEIVRSLITSSIIKEAPPREFYNAINLINKLGVNVNQLAHVANSNGQIYERELRLLSKRLNELIKDLRKKYL